MGRTVDSALSGSGWLKLCEAMSAASSSLLLLSLSLCRSGGNNRRRDVVEQDDGVNRILTVKHRLRLLDSLLNGWTAVVPGSAKRGAGSVDGVT